MSSSEKCENDGSINLLVRNFTFPILIVACVAKFYCLQASWACASFSAFLTNLYCFFSSMFPFFSLKSSLMDFFLRVFTSRFTSSWLKYWCVTMLLRFMAFCEDYQGHEFMLLFERVNLKTQKHFRQQVVENFFSSSWKPSRNTLKSVTSCCIAINLSTKHPVFKD